MIMALEVQTKEYRFNNWVYRTNYSEIDIPNYNNHGGMGIGTRYRNWLKTRAYNNVNDPEHRWMVAEFDPVANRLIYRFIERAFQKPFQFYDSISKGEDLYGFGVKNQYSDAIYARLVELNYIEYFSTGSIHQLIDGYQMTKPEIMRDGYVNLEKCYSDYEIHQIVKNMYGMEQFVRADNSFVQSYDGPYHLSLNDIVQVRVNFIPEIPGHRGKGNLHPVNEVWSLGEYFHTYNPPKNYGIGKRYLQACWDGIVKLMEKSENDHFRQDLFTIVEVPQSYFRRPGLVNQFMSEYIFARENRQVFAFGREINTDGKTHELPTILNQNMVRDSAPTKATTTGVGALVDSEWSRVTTDTGYSITYFMGDPAGAVESGQVDAMKDVQVDIDRFGGLSTSFIIPALKMLSNYGIFDDIIPEDFNWDFIQIKTHWEIDKENRQKALFEASHMAAGGGNPSNFKKGDEADTSSNTPKIATEKKNSYIYPIINDEIKKRVSQTGSGKQRAEESTLKKTKRDVGSPKNISQRTCIESVKSKLKKANPDKDAQALEQQAKKICKKQRTSQHKGKVDKKVDVESYRRPKGKVSGHKRGMPDYEQHKVGVKGYYRDGKHVTGYTRYPQTDRKNEIEEGIFLLNGYLVTHSNVSVEYIGERLNYEFNIDGYEEDGEVENINLEDLNFVKEIDIFEDKTKSIIKFFDDYNKTPADLPPIMVNEGFDILDGNHRAFVYRMKGFCRIPVQFMKRKEAEGTYMIKEAKSNFVMPMVPVASSIVKGVGLKDDKLIVQFHKTGKQMGSGSTYGYKFKDSDTARESYDDMVMSTSKGGFVWDRLRGSTIGPAWGTGNPTRGGTSSSIVPYDKMGRSPISAMSGFKDYQKEAEELREWKMTQALPSGEVVGKKRTYYPEQMGEKRFDPASKFYTKDMGHGYAYNKPTAARAPTEMKPKSTPPMSKKEKKGGEGSVGRPTKGVPYFKYLKQLSTKEVPQMADTIRQKATQVKTNLAEELHFEQVPETFEFYGIPFEGTANDVPTEMKRNGVDYWFDSKNEALSILGGSKSKLYESFEPFETIRYNKFKATLEKEDDEYFYAIVNGFSSTNRFQYWVNNRIQVEFQCPEDIKSQVGLQVPLGIYHNKEKAGDVTLPDWQIVGNYKVLEYDEDESTDVSVIKINKALVKKVFAKLNEDDWVTPILESGKCPDISTSYKTMVKWNEKHNVWVQTGFKLESVAIVPKGNCSAPYCTGDLIRENGKIRDKIKENIKKVSEIFKQKGKSFKMDEIIDLAVLYEDDEDEELIEEDNL